MNYLKLYLISFFLFLPTTVIADTYFNYGVGIFDSYANSLPVKTFSGGYRKFAYKSFFWQGEVGLWGDTAGQGRQSSGYSNFSLGAQVDTGIIVFRSSWGICGITTPDSDLGGNFQFTQDFFIGFKDKFFSNQIGLVYKHISSAGLESPNAGRDFLVLSIGLPW
jgi:hypothetical protein